MGTLVVCTKIQVVLHKSKVKISNILCYDTEWLIEHVAVTVNSICKWEKGQLTKNLPKVDTESILGVGIMHLSQRIKLQVKNMC